jgi:hypothetical protein
MTEQRRSLEEVVLAITGAGSDQVSGGPGPAGPSPGEAPPRDKPPGSETGGDGP